MAQSTNAEVTFDWLYNKYEWKPIKDCPGRYVLKKGSQHISTIPPLQVIGEGCTLQLHQLEVIGKDPIYVIKFPTDGGGLLSFHKIDQGRYVHTLNTPSGLTRKLEAMKVSLKE
eukprot:TRINITY_DN3590_c0_g1_i2.p1 TRINITY_DN3590_c0_g1~~TRINITY_DN3590_c0_g1_i2.p1  ORF type:complete len:126 (+),score=24.03 TRINITY_DN3590_c0_g1_i2:39-380(+)